MSEQIESQRFTLKLASCLRQVEVYERIVGVALPLPTEVHVKQAVLIKAVCHPRMA